MDENPQLRIPKRHGRRGTKVFLIIAGALIFFLVLGVIVKWNTLGLILHPERIEFKSKTEILSSLEKMNDSGRLNAFELDETDMGQMAAQYYSQNESIYVKTTFEQESVESVRGTIWVDKMEVQTVDDALQMAEDLLSPYVEENEVEALEFILAQRLISQASVKDLEYQTTVGNFELSLWGNAYECVEFEIIP